MRYAVIMAGGSGTRLWPMSRSRQPKQLIPFIGNKSLLEHAYNRLDGLLPSDNRYICANRQHAEVISGSLSGFTIDRYLGEPEGRDTLNAVGLAAAVIAKKDPEAVIAIFTADHIIEPVSKFQEIVNCGYALVEKHPETLVTFGITPTEPATGYGYLQLGPRINETAARVVVEFKEKPNSETAEKYVQAGSDCYLWNSGMFVWKATTLLDCIRRYVPQNHEGLSAIAKAWFTEKQDSVLEDVFPKLEKISVDYAIMEPASHDSKVKVAAIPMPLKWLDVGSWPMFAETCHQDADGNAIGTGHTLLEDTRNTMITSSDPGHLIATVGCDDLIIVHTSDATLVCHKNSAEEIKQLQETVKEKFGENLV